MAAASTLSILELLEAILLLADSKTVLLAQRVNKTFRATIKGSEKLQVALFFKQAAAPTDKQYPRIRYMRLWGYRTEKALLDDAEDPRGMDYRGDTLGLNTFLLAKAGRAKSGGAKHILYTHWRGHSSWHDHSDESSALDMYPCSILRAGYLGKAGKEAFKTASYCEPWYPLWRENQTLRQSLEAHNRAMTRR
ncbi:hypothetical protein LTR95_005804 [Oleoguttula sp. CCFEE 5521]